MPGKYFLGIDIGSSSVKAGLLEIETGRPAGSAYSPRVEMKISSTRPGFAEQDPDLWWNELENAMRLLKKSVDYEEDDIEAIGIAYQMHGLVCLDKNNEPVRSSIIWCDSRAVPYGNAAFEALGIEFCLKHFLNSPGNFTAAKLAWVKENEPEVFSRIATIMLPGDYIALKLTGRGATTISGLSEGILWNFRDSELSKELLDYYGFSEDMIAPLVPTFGEQGRVTAAAASRLGIREGIPVTYRAGDQPNNAFSLNVLHPGEVAATAGTSGVVYGITNQPAFDMKSRVNSFVHVNDSVDHHRYGVLMCLNGTGSLNSWVRNTLLPELDYEELNELAANISPGSDGLMFYPFGNGAERILENEERGGTLTGLQFQRHFKGHIARAAQEGIVYALNYGMAIMKEMGLELKTIRAGYANMFLSDVFCTAFANVSGCSIELYNTDGAIGAARAAGVGSGHFKDISEAFRGFEVIKRIEPTDELSKLYSSLYAAWRDKL